MDLSRNPCPNRIIEDVGGSYGTGILVGSAFHFLKGALYDSPNGRRLAGGATAVRMNAPQLGGSFAVWGLVFSTMDCGLVYARNKEDPWNSIAAGAATGGLLTLRQGLRASARSALFGAAFFAVFEGLGILIQRSSVMVPPPVPEDMMNQPQAPGGQQEFPGAGFPPLGITDELPVPEPAGQTGWFAGLFGRKKQQDKVAAKSEVLELELPSTAIPNFDYK